MSEDERINILDNVFNASVDEFETDNTDGIINTPVLVIDLDEVNGNARRQAQIITERLSGYYFDQKYIDEHPYIPAKIAQEIDMIRRLIKMLDINEKAQDSLVTNITSNAGKGSLYQSLTSLQSTTLNIQNQLNNTINNIEEIFKTMQAECEKTFSEKPKEVSSEDGSVTVRGSREFIKSLSKGLYGNITVKELESGEKVDTETGEILNSDDDMSGTAQYSDIVAV